METTKLECPPLEDDEASMIVSTRIRVGRNLADFPLGMTKKKLWECYHIATKKKMNFLTVDVDLEQLRHNFFEVFKNDLDDKD